MLPTPSTSHVNYDQIYEPSEDSYLLLDTLSARSETSFLQQRFPSSSPPPLVLEVGPGSGVVLAFLAANATPVFARQDILTLGIDVNVFACHATATTVQAACAQQRETAGFFLDAVNADLTSSLRPASVDVLVFNPPYVPTEDLPASQRPQPDLTPFERDSHLLAQSYAGGIDGMQTTNRLLAQLPSVLSARGVAYVLLCAQNKPRDVAARIRAWKGNWSAEIVGSSGKKAGWEKLCILRIWRDQAERESSGICQAD